MEKKIARVISLVINPLIVPTFTFIILFSLKTYFSMILPKELKIMIMALIFTTTFLIPFLLIVTLQRLGVIQSISLNDQTDRKYPFFIVSIFYILTYYMIRQIEISPIYDLFALGAALLVVITMFINFFFKISMHMSAIGGVLGGFIAMSIKFHVDIPWVIIVTIICAGLVGTSRLVLRVHRPVEVYSGFLLGSGIMMLLFFLNV